MTREWRMPPPHPRRPLSGPGVTHPGPFAPGIRPPPGPFPHYDMLPPEIMDQKLASQHMEMERLATENQRLAATHGTLRKELAAAQHEIHMLQSQIGTVKAEREQQMRSLMENIEKMGPELKAAETVKSELEQARQDAQNLIVVRQDLMTKVQQLTHDLQRAHSEAQQIPFMIQELESLRLEYQQYRVTYDYEKKLYNDHLESLQVMEKNYVNMAREIDKLRVELTNSANIDRRPGDPYGGTASGPYGGSSAYGEMSSSVNHPGGQISYEDSFAVPPVRGPAPVSSSGAPLVATPYANPQPGPPQIRPAYDPQRVPAYDPQRGIGYDHRNAGYDPQRGSVYDPQRGLVYDAQRGNADATKAAGNEAQNRPSYYDTQKRHGYDPAVSAAHNSTSGAAAGVVAAAHPQVANGNNVPYGSGTPPGPVILAAGRYEAPARGGNPNQR